MYHFHNCMCISLKPNQSERNTTALLSPKTDISNYMTYFLALTYWIHVHILFQWNLYSPCSIREASKQNKAKFSSIFLSICHCNVIGAQRDWRHLVKSRQMTPTPKQVISFHSVVWVWTVCCGKWVFWLPANRKVLRFKR